HGTVELSHGLDGRTMADSSKALAAAFEQPWGATDGLSSRRQQCNPLRFAKRLPVATLASGISQMEDGLRYLPSLAQRRNLAEEFTIRSGTCFGVAWGARNPPVRRSSTVKPSKRRRSVASGVTMLERRSTDANAISLSTHLA